MPEARSRLFGQFQKGFSAKFVCRILDRIESEQPNFRSMSATQAQGLGATSWGVHQDSARRWLLRASTLWPRRLPSSRQLHTWRAALGQQGTEPKSGSVCISATIRWSGSRERLSGRHDYGEPQKRCGRKSSSLVIRRAGPQLSGNGMPTEAFKHRVTVWIRPHPTRVPG